MKKILKRIISIVMIAGIVSFIGDTLLPTKKVYGDSIGLETKLFFPLQKDRLGVISQPLQIPVLAFEFALFEPFLNLQLNTAFFSISGMSFKNHAAFNGYVSKPLLSPVNSLLVSLQPEIVIPIIPGIGFNLVASGGGFAVVNFFPTPSAEVDKALKDFLQEETLTTTELAFKDSDGWLNYGWIAGAGIQWNIGSVLSLELKGEYYDGFAPAALEGKYNSYSKEKGYRSNQNISDIKGIENTQIDFKAIDISFGFYVDF